MNLDAMGAILEAEGLGTMGSTIFLHTMPDVKVGILFRLPLEGIRVDYDLPNRYKHPLQVILRGVNMEGMIEKSHQIMRALTMADTQVGEMAITYVRPRTLPIIYPRSNQSHACEASINFDCCYVLG